MLLLFLIHVWDCRRIARNTSNRVLLDDALRAYWMNSLRHIIPVPPGWGFDDTTSCSCVLWAVMDLVDIFISLTSFPVHPPIWHTMILIVPSSLSIGWYLPHLVYIVFFQFGFHSFHLPIYHGLVEVSFYSLIVPFVY